MGKVGGGVWRAERGAAERGRWWREGGSGWVGGGGEQREVKLQQEG